MPELTQKRLKELLHYCPKAGEFTWVVNRKNQIKAHSIAGTVAKTGHNKGYRKILIEGKNYQSHRLAWLYFYGRWPNPFIDHINQDRSDNRISNLREVSRTGNSKNRPMPSNNTSGIVGVVWVSRCEKWQSQIRVNGRTVYLGIFKDKKDAAKKRKEAEVEYGFHANHGMMKARDE